MMHDIPDEIFEDTLDINLKTNCKSASAAQVKSSAGTKSSNRPVEILEFADNQFSASD